MQEALHRKRAELPFLWGRIDLIRSPLCCRMSLFHSVRLLACRAPRPRVPPPCRSFCSPDGGGAAAVAETRLIGLLRQRFPKATDVAVADVSGGCGAMYEVYVEAPDFKGVRAVRQHQMITDTLKAEIKDMHGLRISTAVSPGDT